MTRYWLFKSEPKVFSIDDLARRPHKTAPWDGVRNYQVRNMLRDEIKVGDLVFFYHSNANPPGIVGLMKVVKAGYPEPNQDRPVWFQVDVEWQKKFSSMITLDEIKQNPLLQTMLVAKRGNRLSITPVSSEESKAILKMSA